MEIPKISQIMAKPVFYGPDNENIWTGVISADDLFLVVSDKKLRDEFISLTIQFENKIHDHRRNGTNISINRLANELIKLYTKLDINEQNKYLGFLALKLDKIQHENPDEKDRIIETLGNPVFNLFKVLINDFNQNLQLCYHQGYTIGTNKAKGRVELKNRTTYYRDSLNAKEKEKFFALIDRFNVFAGEMDKSEKRFDTLRALCESIDISTLPNFFDNNKELDINIGMYVYKNINYNYLLDRKTIDSGMNIPETDMEELRNKLFMEILDTRPKESIKMIEDLGQIPFEDYTQYMANAIIDVAESINPIKFFLGSSINRLIFLQENTFESIKPESITSQDAAKLGKVIQSTKNIMRVARIITETSYAILSEERKSIRYSKESYNLGPAKKYTLQYLKELKDLFCGDYFLCDNFKKVLPTIAYYEGISEWSDELIKRASFDDETIIRTFYFQYR